MIAGELFEMIDDFLFDMSAQISRLRCVPAVRNSFQEQTNLTAEINCRQSADKVSAYLVTHT